MRGMDLLHIERKRREAEFFYQKLLQQEKVSIGDKTPFGYYLSAFLTAAKSVHEIFVFEQDNDPQNGGAYKMWREEWEAKLTRGERSLIIYMGNGRDKEVHTIGSQYNVDLEEGDKLGVGTSRTPEGIITIDGSPGTFSVDYKPSYKFITKDDVERKVTEVCGEYLALRQRMVADFKADFPESTPDYLFRETLHRLASGE
jgi:hypothetical protein